MANDNQYIIDFTDSTKEPIVIDETKIDTSTDITLFGRRKLQYGADMNQNLLSLLEHFACPEDSDNPGYPNTVLSGGKLSNPTLGQFWYNSTTQVPYIWNGTFWEGIFTDSSIATNWGILQHGERIPAPIDSQGNTFDYSECVWVVSPFTISNGAFDSYVIETDINGFITCTYTKDLVTTTGFVNYLIVGIKNNVNKGTLNPSITPSPTPTISPTPSATPEGINLLTGLVSFWNFSQSGSPVSFLDSNSVVTSYSNAFTRNGLVSTVASTIPDLPNAIAPASNTYFNTTPPTYGMSTGNNATYSFGGWFRLPTLFPFNIYAPIFQRGIIGEAQNRSFHLQYTLGTDSFSLSKSNNGISLETLNTSPNVGFSDGNWHFVLAWVDGEHLSMSIQIDNGDVYSMPLIYSATYDVGNLQLGSSAGIPLQCEINGLFYYNRVLNTKERTALYNGFYGNGSGSSYQYVSGAIVPSPTPSVTPTPTPSRTPGVLPLAAQILGTHIASGVCNGGGSCAAITNGITAAISNGSPPYSWEWIYMQPDGVQPDGTEAVPSTPTGNGPAAYTTFTRTAAGDNSGIVYNGYYRLKATDNIGDITYSAPILVTTTHTDP